MSTIAAAERDLYSDVWTSLDDYATFAPGEAYLPLFLQIVGEARGVVLDAGCGSGKGGLALAGAGFDVTLCDLTDDGLTDEARRTLPFRRMCLWRDLRPHVWADKRWLVDYTYCCDVLEHLPPQFTMLAVNQMLRVTALGLFLSVSLVPDQFGFWMGRALHQTVQPFTWWRDALRELGTVEEARDLLTSAVFYVRPR
jgi:SAM-dependent methyltransferase